MRTNPEHSGELPYFEADVLNFFIETRIKLLASSGGLYYGPSTVPNAHIDAERRLLQEGIPMVDALLGLDQLTKDRVFFIALPLKMQRVTATWTRAIALERSIECSAQRDDFPFDDFLGVAKGGWCGQFQGFRRKSSLDVWGETVQTAAHTFVLLHVAQSEKAAIPVFGAPKRAHRG